MRKITYFFCLAFLTVLISTSCGINSNLMFKDLNKEAIAADSIPLHPEENYRLGVNDRFSFQLFPQNGEQLIESNNGNVLTTKESKSLEYTIQSDGTVELPIVGDVYLKGLSLKECEDTLEELYSKTNNNPFIKIKVLNKRAVVFPGNGSDAKVVDLINENTTLMEVLALAGGIAERGKSKSIKIFRLVNNERVVYEIDLSTVEGLKYTDMVIQANDYIYIEPSKEFTREFLQQSAPILGIITSSIAIITVITQLNK